MLISSQRFRQIKSSLHQRITRHPLRSLLLMRHLMSQPNSSSPKRCSLFKSSLQWRVSMTKSMPSFARLALQSWLWPSLNWLAIKTNLPRSWQQSGQLKYKTKEFPMAMLLPLTVSPMVLQTEFMFSRMDMAQPISRTRMLLWRPLKPMEFLIHKFLCRLMVLLTGKPLSSHGIHPRESPRSGCIATSFMSKSARLSWWRTSLIWVSKKWCSSCRKAGKIWVRLIRHTSRVRLKSIKSVTIDRWLSSMIGEKETQLFSKLLMRRVVDAREPKPRMQQFRTWWRLSRLQQLPRPKSGMVRCQTSQISRMQIKCKTQCSWSKWLPSSSNTSRSFSQSKRNLQASFLSTPNRRQPTLCSRRCKCPQWWPIWWVRWTSCPTWMM